MRCRLKLGLFALLVLAGCGGGQQTTPLDTSQPTGPAPGIAPLPPSPAKIGLLLPLTGEAAGLGQDLLDAAQLALFEVRPNRMELLPRDTGDRPQGAEAAARSALDAGAELLVGPLFARSTTAVARLAAARGVATLSFSNDAGVAGNGAYVLGFRPEEQIERAVAYAASQGLSRFGALAADDPYGSRSIAAWRSTVARQPGADAVAAATYPAEAEGGDVLAAEAVRQVAGAGRSGSLPALDPDAAPALLPPPGVDAVLIADGGPRVAGVAGELARYGVALPATRLLGTLRWTDDPLLADERALRGAWVATSPPENTSAFASKFRAIYGREPIPLAVLAYDATALAILLAQAEPPRFTAAQLTDPAGFSGGAGIFRLRPDGLTEHGLAIVELDSAGGRILDPAPAAFAAGTAQR